MTASGVGGAAQGRALVVIVTSASSPVYRRDFLECMCYPPGHDARFSYRSKWIDLGLLAGDPRGRDALIVFCEEKDGLRRFVPVRHAVLQAFEPKDVVQGGAVGPDEYVGVRFCLGEFVHPRDEGTGDLFNEWDSWLDALPQRPGKGAGTFVFEAAGFRDGRRTSEGDWNLLAAKLARQPSLGGAAFFRVAALHSAQQHGEDADRDAIRTEDYCGRRAYHLKSGRSYHLEIEHHLESGEARALKPDIAGSAAVTQSGELRHSVGTQTHSMVILRCDRVYQRETATLILQDPERESKDSPRAQLVLALLPRYGSLWAAMVLLAVGAIAAGVSPDLVTEFAKVDGVPGWVGRHPLPISIAVKLLGGGFVAWGGFLGFRKVPGKG